MLVLCIPLQYTLYLLQASKSREKKHHITVNKVLTSCVGLGRRKSVDVFCLNPSYPIQFFNRQHAVVP